MRIAVHVQPRASRSEVTGLHGDAIKVRLTAPPVDGAANEELIRLLAARVGVPPNGVRIVAGHGGRRKVVEVRGVTAAEAERRLLLATAP